MSRSLADLRLPSCEPDLAAWHRSNRNYHRTSCDRFFTIM